MTDQVDVKNVSTVAEALAGLCVKQARQYWNKYKHEFMPTPASEEVETITQVEAILAERETKFPYLLLPLEVSVFEVDDIESDFVYAIAEGGKRAVGFKLSDGLEIPKEIEGKCKFTRQKSKLAGTIRGSFFVIIGN